MSSVPRVTCLFPPRRVFHPREVKLEFLTKVHFCFLASRSFSVANNQNARLALNSAVDLGFLAVAQDREKMGNISLNK